MQPRGNGRSGLLAQFCAVAIGMMPSLAAAEPTPVVIVDCPVLNDEQRASLEARSRAELAMNRVTTGEIYIHCWQSLVVVEYKTSTAPFQSASRYMTGDTEQWLEQALSLIHGVLLPNSPPAPPALELQKPLAESQPVPQVLPPAPAPRAEQTPTPVVAMPPDIAQSGPRSIRVGVGSCAEFWAKPLDLLPGACASFGVRASSFGRAAVTGGMQWAASRPSQIAVRHWQAGVEWRSGRAIWFAIGAQVSVFQLTPGASALPKTDTTYDPSANVRGGISVPVWRQHVLVGMGLRAQPKHDVISDGQPAFTLPLLALTAEVQYEFEL